LSYLLKRGEKRLAPREKKKFSTLRSESYRLKEYDAGRKKKDLAKRKNAVGFSA